MLKTIKGREPQPSGQHVTINRKGNIAYPVLFSSTHAAKEAMRRHRALLSEAVGIVELSDIGVEGLTKAMCRRGIKLLKYTGSLDLLEAVIRSTTTPTPAHPAHSKPGSGGGSRP